MALLTLSWWPLMMAPWLSPAAAWFIFFSVVVSAIAVMSASAEATSPPRGRLCRSGSSSMVLDRLRSFFVFPVGQLPIDESSAVSGSHCYHCCSREAEAAAAAAATQVCAQPNAPMAMATAEDYAPHGRPLEEEEDEVEAEKEQDQDESISLDEEYALAQQRHSATKPSLASPPPAAASATTAAASAKETPRAGRKKQQPAKVVPPDWRRLSNAGEALEGKAELNARAELFIRQFREDLRLQRLKSILNHTHALGSPTAAR